MSTELSSLTVQVNRRRSLNPHQGRVEFLIDGVKMCCKVGLLLESNRRSVGNTASLLFEASRGQSRHAFPLFTIFHFVNILKVQCRGHFQGKKGFKGLFTVKLMVKGVLKLTSLYIQQVS